jgi:hypothetical protein
MRTVQETAPAATGEPQRDPCPPGSYITDGYTLFRVVEQFGAPGHGASAMLEDCTTLEVSSFTVREIDRMALWLVRAATLERG